MNRYFDLTAPLYEYVVNLFRRPNWGALRLQLNLPTGGLLLDAGGGTGRVSFRLQPETGGVVLCDLSRAMLMQARRKGFSMTVRSAVERLPFKTAAFARILVVDAFHHFGNQREALRELLRVLQPGGRLVIEEQDVRRLPIKLIALGETLVGLGSRFLDAGTLADMVRGLGYSPELLREGKFLFRLTVEKPGNPVQEKPHAPRARREG